MDDQTQVWFALNDRDRQMPSCTGGRFHFNSLPAETLLSEPHPAPSSFREGISSLKAWFPAGSSTLTLYGVGGALLGVFVGSFPVLFY